MIERLGPGGSDDAWRWFIARYTPFVRAVLVYTIGGKDAAAAIDEFWGYLCTSEMLARADRGRRFRSFLAGTVRNFARQWHRGVPIQMDDGAWEAPQAVARPELPEDAELRLWARLVLRNALAELARVHPVSADALRRFYGVGDGLEDANAVLAPQTVAAIGGHLGLSVTALHQTLRRGRQRLRARIEAEVRETLRDGTDVEEELAWLLQEIASDAPGLADG